MRIRTIFLRKPRILAPRRYPRIAQTILGWFYVCTAQTVDTRFAIRGSRQRTSGCPPWCADRGYTTLKRELDATALSIARVQKHYGSTARKGCRRGITGLRNHRDVVCVEDDTQVCAPADISYETHFLPHRLTH